MKAGLYLRAATWRSVATEKIKGKRGWSFQMLVSSFFFLFCFQAILFWPGTLFALFFTAPFPPAADSTQAGKRRPASLRTGVPTVLLVKRRSPAPVKGKSSYFRHWHEWQCGFESKRKRLIRLFQAVFPSLSFKRVDNTIASWHLHISPKSHQVSNYRTL